MDLSERIARSVRELPADKQREVMDFVDALRSRSEDTMDEVQLVGLFADEPELVDRVCEFAMLARERDPLRAPGE